MTEHPYVAPHTSREVYVKGDFSTYPALICPLCNGYQGLSGNGAIKKDTVRERRKRRDVEKGGRWEGQEDEGEEGDTEGRRSGEKRVRKEGKIKDNGESMR